MPTDNSDKQSGESPDPAIDPKTPAETSKLPEITKPEDATEADPIEMSSIEASFWDASQIQAVAPACRSDRPQPGGVLQQEVEGPPDPRQEGRDRSANPLSPLSDPFNGALKRPTQKANA